LAVVHKVGTAKHKTFISQSGLYHQNRFNKFSSLEFIMPRLIGKQSNVPANMTLLIISTIAVLTGLEYIGAINIVDNFGNDRLQVNTYQDQK
jgi:hypothetical protein